MARKVKDDEYADKRNEILDVAQRLVYTRGYMQISIQDIVDELGISKGAFYHYFPSKQAVLEGIISRMGEQYFSVYLPRLRNASSALEKLQLLMRESNQWKGTHRNFLLALLEVWYHDDNAIVRHKTTLHSVSIMRPLIVEILEQGIREGSMAATSVAAATDVALALMLGLSEAFAAQILNRIADGDTRMELTLDLRRSFTEAIAHALGLNDGSLELIDRESLEQWLLPGEKEKQG